MTDTTVSALPADLTPVERAALADVRPVQNSSKNHAPQELFVPAIDDERVNVPLTDTVFIRPMMLSVTQNRWWGPMIAHSVGMINRHYHPQEVFLYTVSGKWRYLEYDWTATTGDFLYEAPGSSHTLVALESEEPTVIYADVKGPLIWLDDHGEPSGYFDVFTYIELAEDHYEKVGLGRDYVKRFMR